MKNRTTFILGMLAGGALLGAGMLLGGMSQDNDTPREGAFTTVTATSLVIVDGRGRTMAVAGFDKPGGGFHAFGPDGVEVATLAAFDAGGSLLTRDRAGGLTGKMP